MDWTVCDDSNLITAAQSVLTINYLLFTALHNLMESITGLAFSTWTITDRVGHCCPRQAHPTIVNLPTWRISNQLPQLQSRSLALSIPTDGGVTVCKDAKLRRMTPKYAITIKCCLNGLPQRR